MTYTIKRQHVVMDLDQIHLITSELLLLLFKNSNDTDTLVPRDKLCYIL